MARSPRYNIYDRHAAGTPEASEVDEQCALIEWCNLHKQLRDYIFHVPNESQRSMSYGNLLKRLGMRAGVSDLFLPYPIRRTGDGEWYHGLWLEMKRGTRSKTHVTTTQRIWLTRMADIGYATALAYGFDEAKIALELYLTGERLPAIVFPTMRMGEIPLR